MISVRSPRCRGSKKIVSAPPWTKRAQCPQCRNWVAVRNNRFCEHWWSHTSKRYDASKRRR